MPLSSPVPATVLFFDHTAILSGGEIALLNLVTHLDRQRFEPVVVLASDGPLREKLRAAGVETHVLPLSIAVTGVRKDSLAGIGAVSPAQLWEIAVYVWRLRGFARARGADILHTNSLKAAIIGGLAGRLSGLPVVWHVRDRIAHDYLPLAATRVFRMLCRVLPDYLIVNSAATLELLRLPPKQRSRVVGDGVVHDGFPLFVEARIEAPDAASAAPNASRPCIGIVGRISPWKGQDIFLQAAAMVRQKYPDARFQIIGAPLFGEEQFELELHALCEELGLKDNVEWLGFRSDVIPLIGQMAMLVHASKTGEPFGQVVVEAMMAGRPVVATDGGGIPEIVVAGQTGLLVPMNDAPAMATAMLCLLDDPVLARAMGQAGQKRAAEKFTITHTVAKVSRLYESVLRDGQKRRKGRWRRGWGWGWIVALALGAWLFGNHAGEKSAKRP